MNQNKDNVEPTLEDVSLFGKLPKDLLIEIFIRVPISKWEHISSVRKQWANLFRGECVWQAALNQTYPLASKTKRWTGPIRQGSSKRRFVALYISKNILGVDTDIDEMLGHIYLFLKDQLELSTTPASGVVHGTLIGQFNNHGHISVLVSKTGLEFVKDYLINEVISTTIPLKLPDIEKKVKIPLIGKVRMGLSNIQIYTVHVQSSKIKTGKNGIFLSVLGATADLILDWSYTYKASFFHFSDHGDASVKVKGMDVKISVNLVNDDGSLKIALLESGCTVKSIGIHINGGASWLYQGVVDAFQKTILSSVEKTVSKRIAEKMTKLDSFLQSLPKVGKIDDSVAVNLTFTGNPVLGDSSVEAGINGLFMPNGNDVKVSGSRSLSFVSGVNRMVAISIQQEVFNSATLVYFNEKRMHMVIGESKNGSVLSTSDWKLILPGLYKLYPNDKMMLNMSVTSPPDVKITENGIDATIQLEISINVQDFGKVLSVARISSVLNVACSAEIAKNNLTGSLRLKDFNATVKSSNIGELLPKYIQVATSTVLESLFLPFVNARLKRGFPLPIPHGFTIKNTSIVFVKNGVMVCTDIASYSI